MCCLVMYIEVYPVIRVVSGVALSCFEHNFTCGNFFVNVNFLIYTVHSGAPGYLKNH